MEPLSDAFGSPFSFLERASDAFGDPFHFLECLSDSVGHPGWLLERHPDFINLKFYIMTLSEKAFDNPFESKAITPARLYAFGADTLARLALRKGEPFISLHNGLSGPLADMGREIGEVDVDVLDEANMTRSVATFMNGLGNLMRSNQLAIEFAFKGKNSDGYRSFFPKGLAEYTEATKGSVDTLTQRLGALADQYSDKLEPELATEFRNLHKDWKTVLTNQTDSSAAATDDRVERQDARRRVEVELFRVVCRIGAEFPDNAAAALAFFDFGLLKAARHPSLDRPKEEKGV